MDLVAILLIGIGLLMFGVFTTPTKTTLDDVLAQCEHLSPELADDARRGWRGFFDIYQTDSFTKLGDASVIVKLLEHQRVCTGALRALHMRLPNSLALEESLTREIQSIERELLDKVEDARGRCDGAGVTFGNARDTEPWEHVFKHER